MSRRKGRRKQRVVLRVRRRAELKEHLSGLAVRGLVAAVVGVLGLSLFVGSHSFLDDFLRRHTPKLDIRTPQNLAGQPVELNWPQKRYWLWVPGVTNRAQAWLRRKNPAIREVHFERNFSANRMVARIESRVPLVRWGTNGIDREGAVFPILASSWTQLPSANFSVEILRSSVGKWLNSLSGIQSFWGQVAAVSDDRHGNMQVDLKTGARVTWGAPEVEGTREKIVAVTSALQDAHEHLGGAALADLRFFDQGRIIVRPKAVR